MSRSKELIEKTERYGAHNYHPLPVVIQKALGSKMWDVDGREYLDFLSCYSALNFGHQHPKILEAFHHQSRKVCVTSRAFMNEELALLGEELAKFCGLDMVLPMNSGAEACETAIKLARKWGYQKKKIPADQANIVVMKNSFHGRTVTLVSFSSEALYRNDFGPYTPGFRPVSFDNIEEIEAAIDSNTVGVLLEPIQAEAGILLPSTGFLTRLQQLCKKKDTLLILDEIQTGLGRTGRDFCYQHEGILPDMVVLGKSLGGGLLPISAVVGKRDVMEVVKPGEHGSTFGGNPLACAVARASLQVLKQERLSERALEVGNRLLAELRKQTLPLVKEVRGKGMLIGVELHASAGGARRFCEKLASLGVLCKETHDHVIRIAPPLNTPDAELTAGIRQIIKVISEG